MDPPLCNRGIDIKEFANKISNFGKAWLVIDSKGDIHGVMEGYFNDMIKGIVYLTILTIDPVY